MLTRLIPFARRTALVARPQQVVRCMSGYAPAHWRSDKEVDMENKNHMNCMPVPEGSWQDAYSEKVKKGNIVILLGIVSAILSFGTLYQTGALYLHSAPPMKNKPGQ